jgi:hypothetical protein
VRAPKRRGGKRVVIDPRSKTNRAVQRSLNGNEVCRATALNRIAPCSTRQEETTRAESTPGSKHAPSRGLYENHDARHRRTTVASEEDNETTRQERR